MDCRLSVEKKYADILIPKIDKSGFLGLNKNNIDRIDLFLFAMALGVKKGKRIPLENTESFVRDNTVSNTPGASSQIYSILVDELCKTNEEDYITNKELAFRVANEYANTGFKIIEKWVNECEDEEILQYKLIEEMDDKFELIQRM